MVGFMVGLGDLRFVEEITYEDLIMVPYGIQLCENDKNFSFVNLPDNIIAAFGLSNDHYIGRAFQAYLIDELIKDVKVPYKLFENSDLLHFVRAYIIDKNEEAFNDFYRLVNKYSKISRSKDFGKLVNIITNKSTKTLDNLLS